ncbi:MAG: redoxin domain-containing protein [Burkholderiaceae bacterium]|nr:redoxin domain-containing protein [Burkholderiaceae bacterium]
MNRKILAFVAIAVLFLSIGLYFGAKRFQPAPVADGAVGALMASSLPDAAGGQRTLAEWQGKTLVVNFWATWCPPCVDEMPELVALQDDLGGKNVQVLGIGIDSPSNIRQFSEKHRITYPLLVAGMEGTELSRQFGNQAGGLPFTVLIGSDGRVRQTYIGRLDLQKLRADLASL